MTNKTLFGKLALAGCLLIAAAGIGQAQVAATISDFGPTAPTPGSDDISQLTVPAGFNNPDGMNYYFDHTPVPGQTFTTGANPNGYVLTSLSIATAGGGASLPAAGQAYVLRLYSVSGSNATLIGTYQSQADFTFAELDWLQWTNLGLGLQPGTQYAYSFARISSGAGWENLANVTNNLYAGGEVVQIPTTGGTMTLGSSHNFDASFDVGLSPATFVTANPPVFAPGSSVTVGTATTVSTAPSAGPGPFHYQWQTDGGSGGTLTNIPSANGTNLAVSTPAPGTYQYAVVVTNSSSSATSAVSTLTVYLRGGATLTDAGTAITPGLYDLSQLSAGANGDAPLNYYDDAGTPPGQTFTTGTNSQGYYLSSVSIGTGGGTSGGTTTLQGYNLYIYSVSGNTATLLANYTNASFSFAYGDWLTWSGFTPLILKSNATYAYTFHRNSSGWAGMATTPTTTDVYPGGQICAIPSAGGTIVYGATGTADAAFNLGLLPIGVGTSPSPFAAGTSFSPSRIVVAGTQVTIAETATGAAPLQYRWQTDGGSGGSFTNILSSSATNLVVNTTGWTPGAYRYQVVITNFYGSATSTVATLTITYADTTGILADIGTVDPLPLVADDVAQLLTGGGKPDGLNYYSDNVTPPGQTFVTGSNPNGYTLTSLAVRTAGGSGQLPAAGQAYVLRLYSVSGSNATLYATYTSQTNFTFVDLDWLRWSGMNLPLANNATYAYSFGRIATGGGWENMGNVSGNPYASGELALIPTGGGTMTFGSSHDFDGTFVAGLAVAGYPTVSPTVLSPSDIVYAGTPVTVSASVTGTGPFTNQWQTDGGNTGTLTNIPGANNPSLSVDTTGLAGLTVVYRLVASNGSGSTIGEAAALTVYAASSPTIVTDITPMAPATFQGSAVKFTLSFAGTLPMAYQWQVDKGTGFTNLLGQTNLTLTFTNLKVSDSGSYMLIATNIIGPGNSSPSTLTVYPPLTPLKTVNFQWHSTEGGNNVGNYAGSGIPGFGSGTYWNQVIGPAAWSPGTYSSSGTTYADDGTTGTGFAWTLVTGGSWDWTTTPTIALLDSSASAYGTQSFTFSLPNGRYSIVLFSCNGTESLSANCGAVFTINGATQTALPTQDTSFVQGNNYVVFTNVVVTGNALNGTWAPVAGKSYGSLNGAQLQYLGTVNQTPTRITTQLSGNQMTLSWPADHIGWQLQAQTNATSVGLGTNWVNVAGSATVNSVTVPLNPANGTVFYRMVYQP